MLGVDHRLDVRRLQLCLGKRRPPELVEELVDVLRGLGHVLVEDEVRPRLVPEELSLLDAQRGDLGEYVPVVGLAALVAAHGVCGEDLFATLAIGGASQERPDARGLQREHPLAGEARALRGLGRGRDLILGESGQVGFRVNDQLVGVGLLQEVVRELHDQARQFGVDRPQSLLLRRGEVGSAANESPVGRLQQRRLLWVEVELGALLVDRLDPFEQRFAKTNVVGVTREHWPDLGLDRLQLLVCLRARQHAEDVSDIRQEFARVVERRDCVVERGGLRVRRNRFDLLVVPQHRFLQRRHEVLRLDEVERRHAEGCRPLRQQRIEGLGRRGFGSDRRRGQGHDAQEREGYSHSSSLRFRAGSLESSMIRRPHALMQPNTIRALPPPVAHCDSPGKTHRDCARLGGRSRSQVLSGATIGREEHRP